MTYLEFLDKYKDEINRKDFIGLYNLIRGTGNLDRKIWNTLLFNLSKLNVNPLEGTKSVPSSFFNKSNLEKVELPDQIEDIFTTAFSGCTKLKTVVLSKSLTYSSSGSFYQCSELKEVYYNNGIESWFSITFDNIWSNPLTYGPKLYYREGQKYKVLTDLVVPDGTSGILSFSFYGYKHLLSLTIPQSVKYIGIEAFGDCTNLDKVVYLGTVSEWYSIKKANAYLGRSKLVITCSDGEVFN